MRVTSNNIKLVILYKLYNYTSVQIANMDSDNSAPLPECIAVMVLN